MHELCFIRCARCARCGARGRRDVLRRTLTRLHSRLLTRCVARSTIYLLIIGTLAVTGIPSAGGAVEPAAWKRDVWAVYWVANFLLVSTLANTAFYIHVALNSCDDDAEVLRFLDELELLAVLPHRLFTIASLLTSMGLAYWVYMDYNKVAAVVMLGVLVVFVTAHFSMHFRIVRASVSSKARPVEGPAAAGALRRAASRANLEAMAAAAGPSEATQQPALHRRSALRGANVENYASGRHVHFGEA